MPRLGHLVLLCAIGSGIAADLPDVTVSWIGNSLPHGPGAAPGWVPMDVSDIAVAEDGTVYTNVFWEEGGANQSALRDGKVLGRASGTRGWGHEGGDAVAVNASWVFYSQHFDNEGGGLKDPANWPPKGSSWTGVSRRSRADLNRGTPFAGGKGGKETPAGCFLPVHETAEKAEISGLFATADELYIASTFDDQVRVHDATTMAEKRRFPVEDPRRLCVDRTGALWIVTGNGRSVKRFAADGKPLPQQITLTEPSMAADLALDRDGNLLVADGGPDNVVRVFTTLDTAPTQLRTIGTTGGIYAGPVRGRFGDLRFNAIAGVGSDAAGNLYVASTQRATSGAVFESYSPAQKLNWRLLGLEFVDRIAEDPGDHTSLYSRDTRYQLDWSKPAGQEWSYRALTHDPVRYPLDPRGWGAATPFAQRVAGKTFLFMNPQNDASTLAVYRFDPATAGEIAIPCAVFNRKGGGRLPGEPTGAYLWTDANGDGQFAAGEYQSTEGEGAWAGGFWVDASGAIWFANGGAGLRRYASKGLGPHGVPIWDFTAPEVFTPPAPFTEVKRVRYLPETDTLYLGGCTADKRNAHWKTMGPVFARYDGWTAGTRTPRWTSTAIHDPVYGGGHASCEPMAFDVAGDFVFVSQAGASEKFGVAWAQVDVYEAASGALVGSMKPTAAFGQSGLMDVVESIRVFRRKDGEYVALVEEDLAAKNIMYRWRPTARK